MIDTNTAQFPQRGNAFSRALAKLFLQLFGWRVTNSFPNVPKAVVIGGPHTSNWDGIFTFAAMMQIGLDAKLMIKDSAMKGPLGPLLRWLGAIPVDRSKAGGVVEQSVEQFAARDQFAMVVSPEGTRSGTEQWKKGFYHIAHKAGVPIVIATADYQKKEITFLSVFTPTGDIEGDIHQIQQYYATVHPRHLERLSAPLKAIRNKQVAKTS